MFEYQAKTNVFENLLKLTEKYSDKDWDWDKISQNPFKKDYEKELKKLRFEHYEEELIQKTWHPSRFMDWCLDNDDSYNN